MLRAWSQTVGVREFNQQVGSDPLGILEGRDDRFLSRRKTSDEHDWIPGDWGYIANTNPETMNRPGLEGENVIALYGGVLWGHIPGTKERLLEEWTAFITKWPGTPVLQSYRDYPNIGLEP